MDAATALSGALGLSGASGLNAWIPLFSTSLLHRLDVIEVAAPYDRLSSTPWLAVLFVLLVADFVGDKVPAVDSVLHAIGTVVAPVSGGVVFAGQSELSDAIPNVVALVTGGSVAAAFHLARAAARPLLTGLTAGMGNPIASLFEDGASGGFTAVALIVPLLAFVVVPIALLALGLAARRVIRRSSSSSAPPRAP